MKNNRMIVDVSVWVMAINSAITAARNSSRPHVLAVNEDIFDMWDRAIVDNGFAATRIQGENKATYRQGNAVIEMVAA